MMGRPSGPMRQRPRRSPTVAIAAVISVIGLAIGLTSRVVETLLPGTIASVVQASSQVVQDAGAQSLLGLEGEPSVVEALLAVRPEQQPEISEQPCPPPQATTSSNVICHTVQRGDTLFGLARRFQTSVETIKVANNLDSSKILVGQKLVIPVCPAPAAPVSVAVSPPVSVSVCPPTRVVVSAPVCPPQVVVTVPVCPPVVCVPVVCVPVCQPVVCQPVCGPFVDP